MLPETTQSSDILLTTLNSKYIHASFSLRYLYANLGEWQGDAKIVEFTIHDRATRQRVAAQINLGAIQPQGGEFGLRLLLQTGNELVTGYRVTDQCQDRSQGRADRYFASNFHSSTLVPVLTNNR